MYDFDLSEPKSVHFIGIGGISMSGLAEILLERGFKVTGSDRQESELTKSLEAKGACIRYPQAAENVDPSTDIFVYTAAIHPDNPEFLAAKASGKTMMTRAELLGAIMKHFIQPFLLELSLSRSTPTFALAIARLLSQKRVNIPIASSLSIRSTPSFSISMQNIWTISRTLKTRESLFISLPATPQRMVFSLLTVRSRT